jgi:hypothetical protein
MSEDLEKRLRPDRYREARECGMVPVELRRTEEDKTASTVSNLMSRGKGCGSLALSQIQGVIAGLKQEMDQEVKDKSWGATFNRWDKTVGHWWHDLHLREAASAEGNLLAEAAKHGKFTDTLKEQVLRYLREDSYGYPFDCLSQEMQGRYFCVFLEKTIGTAYGVGTSGYGVALGLIKGAKLTGSALAAARQLSKSAFEEAFSGAAGWPGAADEVAKNSWKKAGANASKSTQDAAAAAKHAADSKKIDQAFKEFSQRSSAHMERFLNDLKNNYPNHYPEYKKRWEEMQARGTAGNARDREAEKAAKEAQQRASQAKSQAEGQGKNGPRMSDPFASEPEPVDHTGNNYRSQINSDFLKRNFNEVANATEILGVKGIKGLESARDFGQNSATIIARKFEYFKASVGQMESKADKIKAIESRLDQLDKFKETARREYRVRQKLVHPDVRAEEASWTPTEKANLDEYNRKLGEAFSVITRQVSEQKKRLNDLLESVQNEAPQ